MSIIAEMLRVNFPVLSLRIMNGYLEQVRMSSSLFARGEKGKSLARFVRDGFTQHVINITLEGTRVSVFVVARTGADADSFQEFLQKFTEENSGQAEWLHFIYFARKVAGLKNDEQLIEPTEQLWLNFESDIFWTLSDDTSHSLVEILKEKKEKPRAKGR